MGYVPVPQATAKRDTVDPSVMRRISASIEGQLSSTVPFVGRTASTSVLGV